MKFQSQILRGVLVALAGVIAFAFATGGVLIKGPNYKVEISLLDPWVIAFVAIFILWRKTLKHGQRVSIPIFDTFRNQFNDAWDDPDRAKQISTWLLLWCFGILFLGHVARHWSFGTYTHDQGLVHHALFYPFSGKLLHSDLCPTGTYLDQHLSFSLLALTPLTWILKFDELVFLFQALIVAFPLWLGLRKGPLGKHPELWAAGTLVILCNRSLRNSIPWDFREDHLAFLGLFWMYFSLRRGNTLAYFFALVFTLLCKENLFVVTLAFALPIWVDPELKLGKRTRWAIASFTLILSIAYALLAFKVIFPWANPQHQDDMIIGTRVPFLGSNPSEIIHNLLFSPKHWWLLIHERILQPGTPRYLLLLIGPYAFFYRNKSSLAWLFVALPGLAANLVAVGMNQRSLQYHYDLVLLPFLIIAAWYGMRDVHSKRKWAIALALALALSGRWPGRTIYDHWPSLKDIQDRVYLRKIRGPETLASGSQTVLAHLTHLPSIRHLLGPASNSDLTVESILKANQETPLWSPRNPTPRFSFGSAFDASQILIDRTVPWQVALEASLRSHGNIQMISESKSKRFALFRASLSMLGPIANGSAKE